MIINHPHLGPRDASEFTILGDASLINRPNWQAGDADDAFIIINIYAITQPDFIANYGFMNRATGHGWWLHATQ